MAGDHHSGSYGELEARTLALESLLIEKGLLTTSAVDAVVQAYEHDIGPLNGARAVAKAWDDPDFRIALLDDATAALRRIGIGGVEGDKIVAVANSPTVHNLVVCTLCSCYPWPVLGLPPSWYKDPAYRSRAVISPREMLASDFGLVLGDDVEIRVWDSSAEIRYMVVPQRPRGTERLSEDELVPLVTRDSMIGVAFAGGSI